MDVPGFFKYGSIISFPLFGIAALFIINNAKGFSLRKHTFSKSVKYLSHHKHLLIFRLNFIVKAFLDLCFALYVLNHLRIPSSSPAWFMLITSSILFGSLAYFIEDKYSFIHGLLIYVSGLFFASGYIVAVNYMDNPTFTQFTQNMLIIPVIVGFCFLFIDKTDFMVQTICLSIWYFWLLVFVYQYL